MWPVSWYACPPIDTPSVVPARTSEPPCFSVIAMPISALRFCSFGSRRGSYSREYSRGSHSSAIHGDPSIEATAAWVIDTGQACPGSTCAKSMNIAARATWAPGRGSAHADVCAPRAIASPITR